MVGDSSESTHATEDPITSKIPHQVPILALLNNGDQHDSPRVLRIATPSTDWFQRFQGYATHASLIIINCDRMTPGLLSEVEWLGAQGLLQRTLFVVGWNSRAAAWLQASGLKTLPVLTRRRRGLYDFEVKHDIVLPDEVRTLVSEATLKARGTIYLYCPAGVELEMALECFETSMHKMPTATSVSDLTLKVDSSAVTGFSATPRRPHGESRAA